MPDPDRTRKTLRPELEAEIRVIVRDELAGFCAMGLEKIGEDPSAPLANKLAAIFGFGLEKYGSES